MARSAPNGADQTAAQIEAINTQLTELTRTVGTMAEEQKDRLSERAVALKEQAGTHIRTAQAHAAEMTEKARDGASDAYAAAEHKMRQNPATALGVAVGVGFLIGMLATRSR